MSDEKTPKWKSEEWKRIKSRRQRAFGGPSGAESETSEKDAEPKNLVGLSLSGGGIRSAIYNDGFLQGLSHRGFLRYVDFLCSVSGGGYIAGHLVSQARDADHQDSTTDEERKCFHDDQERSSLGRDPITGQVNATRLAGVGGYLSRTLDFLPAYLWSFFFSFAFYIGIVGIVATLAALFWRSFDDPTFRTLYFGTLGLIKGNELTVAFIPTILLVVMATVSEVGLSCWRLFFGFDRRIPKKIHLVVRKVSLVLISLAILTSIAIFIGNGKTNVRSNAGGELFLNNYAQILAISAGIIQILIFLGRDRLFRSERAEAKQWQKHLQRSITTVVLLFLVFSMVHWMGREDISGYTQNRDPHLVRGDITNWYVMDQLFSSYEEYRELDREPDQAESSVSRSLNPLDEVPEYAKPASRWIAFLASGRAGLRFDSWWNPENDLSLPPSPLQETFKSKEGEKPPRVWSLPKRIAGAGVAYWLAMSRWGEEDVRQLLEDHHKRLHNASADATSNKRYASFSKNNPAANNAISVFDFVEDAFTNVHVANAIQDGRLELWNKFLQDTQFTSFLIDGIKEAEKPTDFSQAPTDSPLATSIATLNAGFLPWMFALDGESTAAPSGYLAPSKEISNLVASTDAKLSDGERKSLLDTFRRLHLVNQSRERNDLPSQLLATATANRVLLEVLLPGAVQNQQVPSTLVVPPHDQRARRRWLCIWAVLTLVGMIGGLGQNHIATVFQFYRQQLGNNFLVATHDPSRQLCDEQLHKLHPTDDGLPYPLFLAATLEPSTRNGSYQVEARPFVFSPLFSGRFDSDDGPIPSKQLSFSPNPASDAVTLGDAITLSGAAVTPLMTGNRWLSVILDFFNSGIGQRLQRLDRTGNEIPRRWTRPIVTSAIVILISAIIARTLIRLGPSMVVVIGLLTCLACYCIVLRIGSPGLISSLFFPRNHDVKKSTRDDGRSFYVADGGFYDYLGVTELLRRRCELIVVSDTGANIGNDPLGTLAQMCERASQEMGIRFLDLDHEAPIDFGRLELDEQRLVHQPYLCMRIRYPDPESSEGRSGAKPLEGRLFYCQMSITESDPIEIQHIRNRFPSFPDEPTVNQFYSEEQVSAYRALGYHIANRLCNELQSWQYDDSTAETRGEKEIERFRKRLVAGHTEVKSNDGSAPGQKLGQPWFDVLRERLLTAYRLACYEELSYRKDDIFSEAIWLSTTYAFPAFQSSVTRVMRATNINKTLPGQWLHKYEHSADVRSAYRTAVIRDINELKSNINCFCEVLWSEIKNMAAIEKTAGDLTLEQTEEMLAAHLANIATACQEIHRGRPHSTFQIGGREKLINLCHSFSDVICRTLHKDATHRVDVEKLFDQMDQMIAELIELERSVFQGGEHVTTISFAQCMTTMWGRIVRTRHEKDGLDEENVRERLARILQDVDSMAYGKSAEETPFKRRLTAAFQVTELRHRLDVGLKKTRARLIREALVKSWCIGYFKADEIQAGFDFLTSPTDQDDQKIAQQKPRATRKRER